MRDPALFDKHLAHCLWMAEIDEKEARDAAARYQQDKGYGGLFAGLLDRFDTERSRIRADLSRKVAV